ncbi:DoxX family protein [Paracoccus pacificus]|uniref:DoxX family protein n=1 Tax=Paracoccus pacificus TaxID=1463598 RepID=A0ABW4R7P6_9RHOB
MTFQTDNHATPRLIIPALESVYATLSPLVVTYMRIIAGIAFLVHGWPKITNPMGAVGMVESLGFYPGALWSPLLAGTEVFGGMLLVLGLLTRPAAVATSIVLCVTTYFHWIVRSEGFPGAEKSLLWLGLTAYFAVHGGGRYSLDRLIGRQF